MWIGEARPRWVSNHQQSLRLGDCDDAAVGRFDAMPDGSHVCRSFCGVPLRVALAPVGALCIATRSAHAYSDADEQFLTVVADRVAWVIDGMRARGYLNGEPARSTGRMGPAHPWPARSSTRPNTRRIHSFSQIPLLKTSSAKGLLDGVSRSGGL